MSSTLPGAHGDIEPCLSKAVQVLGSGWAELEGKDWHVRIESITESIVAYSWILVIDYLVWGPPQRQPDSLFCVMEGLLFVRQPAEFAVRPYYSGTIPVWLFSLPSYPDFMVLINRATSPLNFLIWKNKTHPCFFSFPVSPTWNPFSDLLSPT